MVPSALVVGCAGAMVAICVQPATTAAHVNVRANVRVNAHGNEQAVLATNLSRFFNVLLHLQHV